MSESGSVAGAPHAWGWWVLEKLACVEPPLERRQSERTSVLIRDATEVLSWGGIPFSAVERKRWMPVLSDYVNVFGEAEAVLRDKGYQVWYVEAAKLFFAEKGGWDFAADSPTALLGVVAIYEARKPEEYREYWWSTQHYWDFAAMPRRPERPYRSVMERD